MFVGTLSTPDYTSGCASRVETGVGLVAFVSIAELAVDLGVSFWSGLAYVREYISEHSTGGPARGFQLGTLKRIERTLGSLALPCGLERFVSFIKATVI
jgi:hypothetical protein